MLLLICAIVCYPQIQNKRFDSKQIRGFRQAQHVVKQMPSIDMDEISQEDKADLEKGLPPRFGKAIDTELTLADGLWTARSSS